jgi:hypothetical protein
MNPRLRIVAPWVHFQLLNLRLSMFENRVEVKLIKQKGRRAGGGENCTSCVVVMCPLHNILLAWFSKRKVRYLARPHNDDECTKYYVLRVNRQLVRRDIGTRVILKWILRKYWWFGLRSYGSVWGLMGALMNTHLTFGFEKNWNFLTS